MKTETGNATVLIVAQRINTIMNADQIIVLENGRVVGKGTHKELMENCQVYQELALSQLSREELVMSDNRRYISEQSPTNETRPVGGPVARVALWDGTHGHGDPAKRPETSRLP